MTTQTQSEHGGAGEGKTILTPAHSTALYLAGKIDRYDFRHDLVPGLRGNLSSGGPIVTSTFSYVGPFFVSEDHTGMHGPNIHRAIGHEDTYRPITRRNVIANNNTAIRKADLILAFISKGECYGTLCEIGQALALGKRVVMAFAPGIDAADYWLSAMQCAAVYEAVRPCCLKDILADEIMKATAPIRRRAI